jgi:hypothetical protein
MIKDIKEIRIKLKGGVLYLKEIISYPICHWWSVDVSQVAKNSLLNP